MHLQVLQCTGYWDALIGTMPRQWKMTKPFHMECLIDLSEVLVSLVFQNDEPPEITYCVVDQTGTLSLQALTPTQPMPAEEELDAKFAELVVSSILHFFISYLSTFLSSAEMKRIEWNKETRYWMCFVEICIGLHYNVIACTQQHARNVWGRLLQNSTNPSQLLS